MYREIVAFDTCREVARDLVLAVSFSEMKAFTLASRSWSVLAEGGGSVGNISFMFFIFEQYLNNVESSTDVSGKAFLIGVLRH